MEILYGIEGNYKNITDIVKNIVLLNNNNFTIPSSDGERANLFGDHIYGTLKHLKIDEKKYEDMTIFLIINKDGQMEITQDLNIGKRRINWWKNIGKFLTSADDKINGLHKYISLDYGDIKWELPEQYMAIRYIKETDTVLEIGGNIGRNSCIIASILNDDKRLLSLECHPDIVKQLIHNRDKNGFSFNIEPSALSKVSLIQQGWNTFVSETVPDGYIKIPTITYETLKSKYNLDFNVLVADCEGALYQILKDQPDILSTIQTIIIENDFTDINNKEYVDEVFSNNGFKCIYNEAGGWGPCYSFFFQVFQK